MMQLEMASILYQTMKEKLQPDTHHAEETVRRTIVKPSVTRVPELTNQIIESINAQFISLTAAPGHGYIPICCRFKIQSVHRLFLPG